MESHTSIPIVGLSLISLKLPSRTLFRGDPRMILCIDISEMGRYMYCIVLGTWLFPLKKNILITLSFELCLVSCASFGRQANKTKCLPKQHFGEYCWCGMSVSVRGLSVFNSKRRMNRAAMRQKILFCPGNITAQY